MLQIEVEAEPMKSEPVRYGVLSSLGRCGCVLTAVLLGLCLCGCRSGSPCLDALIDPDNDTLVIGWSDAEDFRVGISPCDDSWRVVQPSYRSALIQEVKGGLRGPLRFSVYRNLPREDYLVRIGRRIPEWSEPVAPQLETQLLRYYGHSQWLLVDVPQYRGANLVIPSADDCGPAVSLFLELIATQKEKYLLAMVLRRDRQPWEYSTYTYLCPSTHKGGRAWWKARVPHLAEGGSYDVYVGPRYTKTGLDFEAAAVFRVALPEGGEDLEIEGFEILSDECGKPVRVGSLLE